MPQTKHPANEPVVLSRDTVAGLPALEFASLSGSEGLSQVFQYHISLITPDNPMLTDLVTANVDYKPLVGNSLTVTMALDGGGALQMDASLRLRSMYYDPTRFGVQGGQEDGYGLLRALASKQNSP